MTYLFLDCEWTQPMTGELVSIGLVDETGSRTFYAELDPLPSGATDFVKDTVYPLLQRGGLALTKYQITRRLRHFIASIDDPVLVFDCDTDEKLFCFAIDGFGMPPAYLVDCGRRPSVKLVHLARNASLDIMITSYFNAHPAQAVRQHHAGVDAEALRQGWLALQPPAVLAPWAQKAIERLQQHYLPVRISMPDPESLAHLRTRQPPPVSASAAAAFEATIARLFADATRVTETLPDAADPTRSLRLEYQGRAVYPRFQFDPTGRVHECVPALIAVLPRDWDGGNCDAALWLFAPDDAFGGQTAAEAFIQNPELVIRVARSRQFGSDEAD